MEKVIQNWFIPTVTVIGFVVLMNQANAAVGMDDAKSDTTFRVGGAIVEANKAVEASAAGQPVERCKPKSLNTKKKYYTSGGTATEVIECTLVELKVNPKTGAPKWVVIK